jgi:glyoxylase-like metal-dependent hydrolase (beta-lactamase superfamily II)/rhodanese-related sulfurtransferase
MALILMLRKSFTSMKVEQMYTNCLSEAAYYIESRGEVAIIDPLRDYQVYIDKAAGDNAAIKYVFETHFHADFVSGHIDLGNKTGAPIIYGPGAGGTKYKVTLAEHKQQYMLGDCMIEVVHTPGHTLESTCYLLYDETGKPYCLFTGDTLFVGDVGRPDLSSGDMSSEELADMMYDSLQNVIMPLPDDLIVYPAHGPGSACGKSLGPETFSTLGVQKRTNYALQPQTKEDFIAVVTTGLAKAPKYFAINATINKAGYSPFDDVLAAGVKALSVAEVEKLMTDDAVTLLDSRTADEFENGFVPSSINIGLNGRFAEWVGMLIPYAQKVVLITAPGKEGETAVRMTRVGFDNIIGYLEGGFEAWQKADKPIDMVITIEADELALDITHDEIAVLDVRRENEYSMGHVEGARLVPLQELEDNIQFLDPDETYYVHCAAGYRSMAAASILKKHGFDSIRNVKGGWGEISKQSQIPVVTAKAQLN